MSSLSARSFTVMPSASVIVRVTGGGSAGRRRRTGAWRVAASGQQACLARPAASAARTRRTLRILARSRRHPRRLRPNRLRRQRSRTTRRLSRHGSRVGGTRRHRADARRGAPTDERLAWPAGPQDAAGGSRTWPRQPTREPLDAGRQDATRREAAARSAAAASASSDAALRCAAEGSAARCGRASAASERPRAPSASELAVSSARSQSRQLLERRLQAAAVRPRQRPSGCERLEFGRCGLGRLERLGDGAPSEMTAGSTSTGAGSDTAGLMVLTRRGGGSTGAAGLGGSGAFFADAALLALHDRCFGEDVAGRQRDVPLARQTVDELPCDDLFDRARGASSLRCRDPA